MAFYGYRDDSDCWYSTASTDYYHGPTPLQSSAHYSSPDITGEPQLTEHESSAYYTDDSFVIPSELNCSVYTFSNPKVLRCYPDEYHASYNYYESSENPSESSYNYYESSENPSEMSYFQPKFLQYQPPAHDLGYFPPETKFTISYSTVGFNEPEFEDYDPTPYGGGYDPVATYGKPLPPSDAICYPRKLPQSDGISPENFPYSSIPSPYGKDENLPTKPPAGSKPAETKTETCVENGDKVAGDDGEDVAAVGPGVIQSDGLENGHSGPQNGLQNGHPAQQNGLENGLERDHGYERHQMPYGSGLETLDICESIFGYWPCLAKMEQQQKRDECRCRDQERRTDPWESAANYLFGSPVVYEYENHHHQHHQSSWNQ